MGRILNLKQKLPKLERRSNDLHVLVIGILAVLLVISNFQFIETNVFGRLSQLANAQKQVGNLKQQVASLENNNTNFKFDIIRIQNASNIILAIQDFYYQNSDFPDSLATLEKQGLLDSTISLNDPENNKPYFYQKRAQDFVLCIRLSDSIKGVNTDSCPSVK